MVKLIRYFILGTVLLMQAFTGKVAADKLAHLRSSKKIVAVKNISAPYFAIQILALEKPPQNPSFFKNIDQANEYYCTDGYVRYTVGTFSSKEEARQYIPRIKELGYTQCFVVDIRDYRLKNGGGTSSVVTNRNTIYTVQLAAYRYPVYTSEFEEFDDVMEFYPNDKIYRYTVGAFSGEEAIRELNRIKAMGYPKAYLVPLEKYEPFRIE
ncbi:SPOR domain-containing protein [Thermophagus sp. OGC60D27]|uniref:SPOR domain-containing protein n=1 Tax=Thermophagus sp. OGC60D27 TaxID=3458415 RepID=UPI0040381BB2